MGENSHFLIFLTQFFLKNGLKFTFFIKKMEKINKNP